MLHKIAMFFNDIGMIFLWIAIMLGSIAGIIFAGIYIKSLVEFYMEKKGDGGDNGGE